MIDCPIADEVARELGLVRFLCPFGELVARHESLPPLVTTEDRR